MGPQQFQVLGFVPDLPATVSTGVFAAVAACLAVDPAGLEQHINDAVGPQDGSACRRSGCPTKRRSMQERWRSVLFGSAAPTSRLFSCVKRA